MQEESGSKLIESATQSGMARNSLIYRKERQDTKCETAMIDNTAAHSSSRRPDERPAVDVGCPICENLKRAMRLGSASI